MIAELVPVLKKMSREQKLQLMGELQEELLSHEDDVTMQDPLKSEILAELERRRQYFLDHPESAMTLNEARRRMFATRE